MQRIFACVHIRAALRGSLIVLVVVLLGVDSLLAYPAKGTPAPPLDSMKLLQAPVGARADWASLRSKVLVLEFWATWCGPCVVSIPHWNDLAARLDPAKFQFITVDQSDDAEKISVFIQRKPMAGWAGVDRGGLVSKRYGVEAVPATMIIDRKGRFVAATTPDELNAEDLNGVYEVKSIRFAPAPETKSADQRKADTRSAVDVITVGDQRPVFELSLTPAKQGTRPFTGIANGTFEKRSVSAMDLIADAYQADNARIDWRGRDGQSLYNFRVTMEGLERLWSFAIYQQDVSLAFRVKVHKEQETRKVLVLRTNEDAHELLNETGLDENTGKLCGYDGARFVIQNVGMDDVVLKLEKLFGVPVLNETGRRGRFEASVAAREGDLAGLKESLVKEAGLVLTEEEKKVEMLVVENEDAGTGK